MKEHANRMTIEHEGMHLGFAHTEKGWMQITLNTAKALQERVPGIPFSNFQLAVAGRPHGYNPALITGLTALPTEMGLVSESADAEGMQLLYRHEQLRLKVQVDMRFIPGAAAIRQTTVVTNEGDSPVVVTHLSSMCVQGVATDGLLPWYDKRKIRVHYCRQTWNGEGQWRFGDLEELGLYPTSVHPSTSAVHFSSVGSWSTGKLLPLMVLEDLETGKTWYCQLETSANWHLEIGYRGSWDDDSGGLFIHADGADERFGGWSKRLLPGESYEAVPAAFGCCEGDFTDAIRELTAYRRYLTKGLYEELRPAAVVYNDYMNTLWGDPSKEKLMPLVDAAAAAGCEYFCMDAGWFGEIGTSWSSGLGDWQPSRDRFGEEGLASFLAYIAGKGMEPGLWLEMEVCGENAALATKPDDWFIRRYGIRVGGGARSFLQFGHPDVRSYMHGVVDSLVEMGVRYFKNDYNLCIGPGDDTGGQAAAEGLRQALTAFYRFIDEVRTRHPHVRLESCSSGGMRADYEALAHFHLQSSSDQEDYRKYPSIIGGSLAAVLPEQLGIWAYPNPLLYQDLKNPEILKETDRLAAMADGEQTIFNMVNGMCGNLYLSGHIHLADEANRMLIAEAVELFKRERAFISQAYPIWPLGFTRINDGLSWAAVGLASRDRSRLLLSVWRLGDGDEYRTIPLVGSDGVSRAGGIRADIVQLYPCEGYAVDCHYSPKTGQLTVRMPKLYQARLFEIRFAGNYG
ncbi:glycoside hydrolase family 36 protein [Cohnella hashimotonis]|uniref:Alpha-galactosidase n=1 Tax=Cohnella hashimotonis TaxID=2826895 RepID=A0ABT6TM53_9BACL|nr:glycoside hydrolase family 36 protein [Cohnella hashimotonis]MDI4647923.1 alpha-galactosidase [Cohnella hashimotonis]